VQRPQAGRPSCLCGVAVRRTPAGLSGRVGAGRALPPHAATPERTGNGRRRLTALASSIASYDKIDVLVLWKVASNRRIQPGEIDRRKATAAPKLPAADKPYPTTQVDRARAPACCRLDRPAVPRRPGTVDVVGAGRATAVVIEIPVSGCAMRFANQRRKLKGPAETYQIITRQRGLSSSVEEARTT
jgi:hypothetical protein